MLVILSGGQDLTTVLYMMKQVYKEVHAITFDYGQRHIIELTFACIIAEMAGVKSHETIRVHNILNSSSPLTSNNKLEQYEDADQMDKIIGNRIEKTFVPMRNALFLTIAANRAIALDCQNIGLGICEADNANYPDCRDNFLYAAESYVNLALGNDLDRPSWIKFHAPLLFNGKAESIRIANLIPGCMEALAYSHTSYDGKYPPTDMNHANVLRAAGFEEAGLPDPLVLRAVREGLMSFPATENYCISAMEYAKEYKNVLI